MAEKSKKDIQSTLSPVEYSQLLLEVKERVRTAQYAALKAVNTQLVGLYWDMGKMIVERQKDGGWGKSVVERLSADLQEKFPGIRGFSVQNLWYMRQYYLEFSGDEKLQPLVGEIAWELEKAIIPRIKELKGQLPSSEAISNLLEGIYD